MVFPSEAMALVLGGLLAGILVLLALILLVLIANYRRSRPDREARLEPNEPEGEAGSREALPSEQEHPAGAFAHFSEQESDASPGLQSEPERSGGEATIIEEPLEELFEEPVEQQSAREPTDDETPIFTEYLEEDKSEEPPRRQSARESSASRAEAIADYLARNNAPLTSDRDRPRRESRLGWLLAGIVVGAALALPWFDPVSFDRLVAQVKAPIEDFLSEGIVEEGPVGSADTTSDDSSSE